MERVDSPLSETFEELDKSRITCEENHCLIEKGLSMFVDKFILKNVKALNQVPKLLKPKTKISSVFFI